MNKSAWWVLTAFFAVTAGVEGLWIYRHRPGSEGSLRDALATLPLGARGAFEAARFPFERFDRMFDDSFFERYSDPFSQLRDYRDRMTGFFEGRERALLDKAWDSWERERLGLDDLQGKVTDTPTRVTVSVTVPNLQGAALRVDVDARRIRLWAESRLERADARGPATLRVEDYRQYEKIIPVPAEAVPGTDRVERDGDTVRIVFKRRMKAA